MPLHLLHHKSWHVYNKDNVERVKHDEEQATVAARDEEQRQRANDANDQLIALRGQEAELGSSRERPVSNRDDAAVSKTSRPKRQTERSDDRPLDLDNISNMRFKDAAGRGRGAPWYANTTTQTSVGKDVWGNEDANRKVRDEARLQSNDPLVAMRRGVKQLRVVEQQREAWREQRERDLNEVEELARKERHRRRHRHHDHHSRSQKHSERRRRRSRSRDRSRSPRK